MTKTPSIKIAVIGGGLAGATIANALLRHPHLDAHVYESAPEFSERGAAVGLADDAQRALKQVVGETEASALLERAGAVIQASTRLCIVRLSNLDLLPTYPDADNSPQGSGPRAGTVMMDLGGGDPKDAGRVLHRASLLRELLAPIPTNRLHASKTLSKITPTAQGNVKVTFRDGQEETFDAVIGADGIFGEVRRHVLQEAADAEGPSPAGFWDCRNLIPFDKARDILGAEYFEQDRQYGWAGSGAFIMHDVLENRTKVQCVISAIEKDHPKDRKRPLTREFLEGTLRDWLDGPVGKGMIEVRWSPYCIVYNLVDCGMLTEMACVPDSSCSTSPIPRRIRSGSTNLPAPMPTAECVSPVTPPMPRLRGRAPVLARRSRMP